MSFLLLLMIFGLKPIVSLLSLIVAGTLEGIEYLRKMDCPKSGSAMVHAILDSRSRRLNILGLFGKGE